MGPVHRREILTTDASITGWGAVWNGRGIRDSWTGPWTTTHINALELRAVQ